MIWKKFVVLSFLIFVSGCAGAYSCKDQIMQPPGFSSQIYMVGCGTGGDTRPGMTSDRAFVIQKDSDGNESIAPLDTGFASEGSTKNKVLEIINTGAQGGLQAVTAGQFKPNKYNSSINNSGTQNQTSTQANEQTTDVNQSQNQNQSQKQKANGGNAASNSSSNSAANANAAANSAATNTNTNKNKVNPGQNPGGNNGNPGNGNNPPPKPPTDNDHINHSGGGDNTNPGGGGNENGFNNPGKGNDKVKKHLSLKGW